MTVTTRQSRQDLPIGDVSRHRVAGAQAHPRMAAMADARERGVELAVREDGAREVDADGVEREALAAVERRRVRGRERELPADERVAGRERRAERDARDEDVLRLDDAHAREPAQDAHGHDALAHRAHDDARVLHEPPVRRVVAHQAVDAFHLQAERVRREPGWGRVGDVREHGLCGDSVDGGVVFLQRVEAAVRALRAFDATEDLVVVLVDLVVRRGKDCAFEAQRRVGQHLRWVHEINQLVPLVDLLQDIQWHEGPRTVANGIHEVREGKVFRVTDRLSKTANNEVWP